MPTVPTVSGLSTRDCLLVSLTFFPLFNLIHFFLNFLFFFEEPTYPSSDSRCASRHLQQSIDKMKLEIQHKILYQSNLSTKLEKLTEDMEKQTDIIADIEKELTKLELEKKQKRENERKCRDKREKIEAKIQQLQKESSEQLDLERSLRDDIDRMSQTERDVQYLISQSKSEKNKISKQYKDESGKERECSQTINSLQLELHKLELQINRRSENLQYQPRQMPNSNENGKY
jgi:chromosome segregation ATPase